jgi:ribose transport system permease protein
VGEGSTGRENGSRRFAPSPRSPRVRAVADILAPAGALIGVSLYLAFTTRGFATAENLRAVGLQVAVIAIVAVGQTAVIVAGGIDLSVGSVVALSGVTATLRMAAGDPPLLAALLGVAAGAGIGLFNGLLITGTGRGGREGLPPFIVTLGTLLMARGLAMIITGGNNISGIPRSFRFLGSGDVLGVPTPVALLLLVAVLVHFCLARTRFGRHCVAIGSNREAARLSGVPVDRTRVGVYLLCGALAAFAGVVHAARLGIGQPTTGESFELEAIAAAVIGGASLAGGQGQVPGTLVGALLISVLRNGGDLRGLEPFKMQFMTGAFIILAVLYDFLRRSRRA